MPKAPVTDRRSDERGIGAVAHGFSLLLAILDSDFLFRRKFYFPMLLIEYINQLIH